ncbi:MAG: Sua5/YciO/YrdC/YwlC family protein [Gammaproteobacteria bacterium]|nr:Sua5/YciO/YrdC/YwlC family protein [Gammaproteobacteria bacterium]
MHHPHIQRAARLIKNGGIIAYATEYCFGLGCDPRNPSAVKRLLQIKERAARKGVILLAADVEQLMPFVTHIPPQIAASWPGPYTWLVEPSARAPRWITGRHPRIAVRVTAHVQAAALCRAAGMAIVSTSANRAGEQPARTYRDVLHRLGGDLDYVLPGQVGELNAPTPIGDAATGAVIRAG